MVNSSNGDGGSVRRRIRSHLEFDKIRRPHAARFVRHLTKFEFPHFKKTSHGLLKRPSVAFTAFEIKDKRSSVKSSLLLLFAIVEGVASFVLPITDAFGPPKFIEHQFYFEVFQIVQYITSILSIVYLQALMMYYNRKTAKREMIWRKMMEGHKCNSNNDKEEDLGESSFSSPESPPAPSFEDSEKNTLRYDPEKTPSTSPESERSETHHAQIHQAKEDNSLEHSSSKNSFQDESVFKEQNSTVASPITISKTSSQDESVLKQQKPLVVQPILINNSRSDLSIHAQEKKHVTATVAFDSPPLNRRPTKIGRMFGDTVGAFSKVNPPFTRDPDGINLYLRLGTALFGFGFMIMDGFRVADQFRTANSEKNCHSVLWIPMNAIHAIYIFMQTYFLFKYHRIVFNVQKFFIRFIMCHMAVANLGQWLSTVVQEVVNSEEEVEHSYMDAHNITNAALDVVGGYAAHHINQANCSSQAEVFIHYLIPCGVEYSLISGAIFYKMFQRTGILRQRIHSLRKNEVKHLQTDSSEIRAETLTGISSDYPTECHRAHKGLFLGLLLFLTTFVVLALFYSFLRAHKHLTALYLYQINNIVLIVVGIIAVSAALARLRVLNLRELSEEDAFDDNLLLLGLLAILFYDMFLLVPAIGARNEYRKVGIIFVGKAILEITQALLQVFLILEASRRKADTIEDTIQKPGRSLITFLLIINLAMWIINTFGLKYAENHEIFRAYYSALPWKIISHLSLPLIIFFRFHSTVCLADIWTNAYRMHKGIQV